MHACSIYQYHQNDHTRRAGFPKREPTNQSIGTHLQHLVIYRTFVGRIIRYSEGLRFSRDSTAGVVRLFPRTRDGTEQGVRIRGKLSGANARGSDHRGWFDFIVLYGDQLDLVRRGYV